jgi:ATP-dependent helicase/nuclease subunit B
MIENDIHNQKHCFLLVPEQQAYISERDLSRVLPQNAGLYFEVVHFSGLAEDVFRRFGGVTRASLSGGMKCLLMWDTLRSLSPLLNRYGKGMTQDITLTSLMVRTIEELRSNGIESDALEEAAKRLPKASPLYQKLMDLSLIEAEYHHRIENAFGQDPSDRLQRLAHVLRIHRYFDGCNVYVDSFTSFTAQEYSVLHEILKQADNVSVTLMTDAFLKPLPQFESTTDPWSIILTSVLRLPIIAQLANVQELAAASKPLARI